MSVINNFNVAEQVNVIFQSAFTTATNALAFFGVFDYPKNEPVKPLLRKWLFTVLRSAYWSIVLCFLFMISSSSMYLVADNILHASEIMKSSASSHPMIDILCDFQFLIESIRGVAIIGWLRMKGHEILLLIRDGGATAALFHIIPAQLLRLRYSLILAMVGVSFMAAVIAGLTAWSWLAFFTESGVDSSPYPAVPAGWYIALWMSTCVLLTILSRFLALIVIFLTVIMCLCASKLFLEMPDAEEILKNSTKPKYILAEVRFKYVQLITLANQISDKFGLVILWGLISDVVSVCGYVARNFELDIPEWSYIGLIRSMVAGIAIIICFIFAMHWPSLLLHKQGLEILDKTYRLQASPLLRVLLETDESAQDSLEYLLETIRKRPLVISPMDVVEFTGKFPTMVLAVLTSYTYLLYEVIKDKQSSISTPCTSNSLLIDSTFNMSMSSN